MEVRNGGKERKRAREVEAGQTINAAREEGGGIKDKMDGEGGVVETIWTRGMS